VTVATTHPTRNLVEFQHTPAGHTRPTYTVYFLLKWRFIARIAVPAAWYGMWLNK
jgi:hypothetical protein